MRTLLLSWFATLGLGAAVLAGGCLSADKVELLIISTEPIAGAPAFQGLRVQVFDTATGEQVVSQTVDSVDGALAGLGALREGRAYVLALEALFGAGTCADDRAVGVSMPFVHQGGGYSIPIQVGCADEFGRTLSQPIVARLGAGLETTVDGTTVLAGGIPRFELRNPGSAADVIDVIERYDPFGGGFRESGTMLTARAFPALQAVPQGGVAVFGGALPGLPPCEGTIELIVGTASTAKGSLTHRRCLAAVALLPGVERLVVGGGSNAPGVRPADFEAYDVEAETKTESEIEGQVYRLAPRFVPLGDGETMLAVGGVDAMAGGPIVEAVHFGDGCPGGEAPCTFPIPAPAGVDQRGLMYTAAAYAECPTGGGTVYITGGVSGTGEDRRALDQILCVREEDNVADLRLVRAGTLPEPRARHEMVVVRGPSPRLLIVGGGQTASITDNLLEDALLVPIDPCACVESSPQVLRRIPLPFTGSAVLHRLALLHDGSVLLVGGARIFNDDQGPIRYEALGEAALFVPELP